MSVLHGARRDAGHVRARAGLGDRERADRLAADDSRQVPGLLLVGAKVGQPRGRHVGVDDDAERDAAGPASGQLLRQHHGHPEVGAPAAVLLGVFHSQEAQLSESAKQLARNPLAVLPFVDVRDDLCFDEAPNRRAEEPVLFPKVLHPVASGAM